MKIWPAFAVSAALVIAWGCDKGGDKGGPGKAAPGVAQKDGAEGLKALFAASHAACNAKDFGKGKQIVMSVIPTKDQVKKALKDDVPADKLDKVMEGFKEIPSDDQKVACIFAPPGRTEIRVHASTVEDLVAYKEGTPAFEEFPGGARTLAETILRPGTTFYEVEVTEPGQDRGTKYHMFFWDGGQWRMLGPAWRALR